MRGNLHLRISLLRFSTGFALTEMMTVIITRIPVFYCSRATWFPDGVSFLKARPCSRNKSGLFVAKAILEKCSSSLDECVNPTERKGGWRDG